MMQITASELLWLMLANAALAGLLVIISAMVTGYLVFRTKREQYEGLFPPARRKEGTAINIDEFSVNDDRNDDNSGLPPIIAKMNERMGQELAAAGLKGGHK